MKNKKNGFLVILVLLAVNSCNNKPPVLLPQGPPSGAAATDRESDSPDRAALDDLEAAIARAKAGRQQAIDIDCPSIFPDDWESADSLYAQAEQQKKTSTLRETQESTARYYAAAEAFEALSNKTLVLFPEGKQEEVAAVNDTAPSAQEQESREEAIAVVTSPAPPPQPKGRLVIPTWTPETPAEQSAAPLPFPARYTVRSWRVSRDSLRNIAARSWVYNDPGKWEILYNANKSRMPNPNNPNLIVPGMVLDIPSIKGEVRQGMWEANRSYPTLK